MKVTDLHGMLDLQKLYGIAAFAPIPLSECVINKPYLLDRAGLPSDGRGSALPFLLPYYTAGGEGGNVSMYAVAEDYHRYCASLFEDMVGRLSALSPGGRFAGFADHAPIFEVDAAAKAGLGFYGDNGLLISREYSSFVFIGGIYTDADADAWHTLVSGANVRGSFEPEHCPGCGMCRSSCPAGAIGERTPEGRGHIDRERCLSAVTQKKKLTAEDEDAVAGAEYVWGCDVCQLVCPFTKAARAAGTLETPLSYFKEKLIKTLDEKTLCELIKAGTFGTRAFAWRGEGVALRNLHLKEGKKDKNDNKN